MDVELSGQIASFKQLQRMLRYGGNLLSKRALSLTVQAIGLPMPTSESSYNIREVLWIATARTILVVEGWSYAELSNSFHNSKIKPEDDKRISSVEDIEMLFQKYINSCKSKSELAREFQVSIDTVFNTFREIGISTKKILYPQDEQTKLAEALKYLDLGLTFSEVRLCLSETKYSDVENGELYLPCYTKRDLSKMFGISTATVKRTLLACRIPTEIRAYNKIDYICFKVARNLIEKKNQSYTTVRHKFV